MDMVCTSNSKIGLIGSLFFAGWATSILPLPWLADKHGRQWIFLGSCVAQVIAMSILTFLSSSLNLSLSLVFVMGLATSGTTTVGFVYG